MKQRRPALIAATALSVLLSIGGAGSAHADTTGTDLYVSKDSASCTDSGGGTQAAPFCSITAAAAVVEPGQTVHIAASTAGYGQPVVISRSGTPGHPITFAGDQRQVDIPALTISGAHDITVTNAEIWTQESTAVSVQNGHSVTLDDLTMGTSGPSSAVLVDVDGRSTGITLSRDSLNGASPYAVSADPGATDFTVSGNVFDNGGVLVDGVSGLALTGNTLSVTSGQALAVSGSSSGSIENNVATGTGTSHVTSWAGISVSAASAARITSDYNSINSLSGTDYLWGGVSYPNPSAFYAATGQGAHDVVGPPASGSFPWGISEGSVLIDSADASAPGVTTTDANGLPRVNDPLVADTGTGDSRLDRGAFEFQAPFSLTAKASITEGMSPVTTTVVVTVINPWSLPVDHYGFDFGDGSAPVTSPVPSMTHTYSGTVPQSGKQFQVQVRAYAPDGSVIRDAGGLGGDPGTTGGTTSIQVRPTAPLWTALASSSVPALPDHAAISVLSNDPQEVKDNLVDFGDGTPAVHVPQMTYGTQGVADHTFPAPGTYTVRNTATDVKGRTATTTWQVTVGAAFVPITPQRFLDTRAGVGATKRKVGPGGVVRLKVAGVKGVPASGVVAVTMNVTDANATLGGWVSAYPDGKARPGTSNLDFKAGETNPNEVTVAVGANGYVDLYNASGNVDLIADVQGYFTTKANAATTMGYFTIKTPTRVLDTRSGLGAPVGPVHGGGEVKLALPSSGVPVGATAVVLNLTETGATTAGWVSAAPNLGATGTSNLNFRSGQTTSNLVVLPLDSARTVRFFNRYGTVNLIADVQGYYTSGSGDSFVPLTPTRLVDTRKGTGTPKQRLGADTSLMIRTAATHGVPQTADAVLLNLTGSLPSATTWITGYANGTAVPRTSDLNPVPGQIRPVLTVLPVGSAGFSNVYNYRGTIDIIGDLAGYYAPTL